MTAPRVIDPFEAPHAALTTVVAIAVGPPVLLTVAEVENIQPFASHFTAYVPADIWVLVVAVKALPSTEVYGARPPGNSSKGY